MVERLEILGMWLLAACVVGSVGWLGFLVFARVRRLAVTDAQFGFGPIVLRVHLLGVPVRFRLLPLTNYVRPYPPIVDSPRADAERNAALAELVAAKELRGYDELALWERMVFVAIVPVTSMGAAFATLGASAPSLILSDARAYLRGVIGPFSNARESLEGGLQLLRSSGALAVACRATAVVAFASLLSLANINHLAKDRRAISLHGAAIVQIALLVTALAWLVAYATWLFR